MTNINKKLEIEELTNEMYNLNSQISAFYIAKNKGLSKEDTNTINHKIGKWIKKLRGLYDI
jgi:hypothetical protein